MGLRGFAGNPAANKDFCGADQALWCARESGEKDVHPRHQVPGSGFGQGAGGLQSRQIMERCGNKRPGPRHHARCARVADRPATASCLKLSSEARPPRCGSMSALRRCSLKDRSTLDNGHRADMPARPRRACMAPAVRCKTDFRDQRTC